MGTLCYMVFIIIEEEVNSYLADLWNFGCVIDKLMTLKSAFVEKNIIKLTLKIV
jgi:hypothetical protein